jgi:hypothetical protein
MGPLIAHLALVSESQRVGHGDLMKVAAALQKQATRDLGPIWGVSATIDAFEKLEDVQLDYWSMIVRDDIGYDAAGIHLDRDGQPFALISSSADVDKWSLTASHEACEMLADPFGDRLVAGDSPKEEQGRVLFLVEVCDPCEAADFGYTCNGILVSDFYTPQYFDPIEASGVRYSFTGAVRRPRQVLKGGYLSWKDPVTGHWWQDVEFPDESGIRDLGVLTSSRGGFRAEIDRVTAAETAQAIGRGRQAATVAGLPERRVAKSTQSKAITLREDIAKILGASGSARSQSDKVTGRRQAKRVKLDG